MTAENNYVSRTDAARLLNLRRDQMIYRIKRGHIKSERVGWNYLIPRSELTRVPTTDWYKAILEREAAA